MQKIKKFFIKREWLLVLCLVFIFLIIRLPGVHQPLHQDEYKWPMVVNPASTSGVSIPHPPLGEFIYRNAGLIVGFNTNFRYVPLFFGTVNLLLLYYLVRFLFGRREAFIASLIWIFAYFSVLASLMVDTDGQIMPFFFLLALVGYYKFHNNPGKNHYLWLTLLIVACVLGFLVKVSFVIAIGAILADFLWSRKSILTRQDVIKYSLYSLAGVIGLIGLLFVMKFIFPYFGLAKAFKYWEHFLILNRGWFQTFIQCAKAILYTSPFLILIPFFKQKKDFSKIKILLFFILFAFIFYIVLFDFSIGALDRYLQLLILPLTIMTTIVITPILFSEEKRKKEFVLLGVIVALIFIILQSVPHYVPPLHPKEEWLSRIFSLKWNFVYPFSGGSGPLGFYVSFLFIGLTWVVSFGALIFAKAKPQYRKLAIAFLIPLGIAYNGVFIEEYLVGFWNGNAPALVGRAVEFIKNDTNISKVIVYNDNGGNEIREINKYARRMYAAPEFLDVYEKYLKDFSGHVLYIDIPRVSPNTFYSNYLNSCSVIYKDTDKYITVEVLDCQKK